MKLFPNPYRGAGMPSADLAAFPQVSTNDKAVLDLLSKCPAYDQTPLISSEELADEAGVAQVWVKDERDRIGLGSFKALGAAYVIAGDAVAANAQEPLGALDGRVYVTASAGNHGLSVAAGAKVFGAKAVIYLSETVPECFAERLREKGAQVVRAGQNYEESMSAALEAAEENGWTLLSDSSWPGYFELSHRLMEGYLAMASEAISQVPQVPTHVFLQAGVGGLAGAVAALVRDRWGDEPEIIVVEPEAAPALTESIRAGGPIITEGPVSNMGRLDCKEPSYTALKGLAQMADQFALISEEEAEAAMPALAHLGLATSPSGGAGLVALRLMAQSGQLDKDARCLCFLSEGA